MDGLRFWMNAPECRGAGHKSSGSEGMKVNNNQGEK